METKWEDVAHLYFGCEGIAITEPRGIEKMIGVNKTTLITNVDEIMKDDFKPILRPLSDITQDEVIEWAKVGNYDLSKEGNISDIHSEMVKGIKQKGINFFKVNDGEFELLPHFVLFCLKRSFDIFGLIKSSQAIDKTELTAPIGDK